MSEKGSRKRNILDTYLDQNQRSFRENRYIVNSKEDANRVNISFEKISSKRDSKDVTITSTFSLCISDFFSTSTISSLIMCKVCKNEIRFAQTNKPGLGFIIAIQCKC